MLRLRALAAVAAAGAAVVMGAAPASALGPLHHQTVRLHVTGKVVALSIRGEVGDIRIVAGTSTRVVAKESWNLTAPTLTHSLKDGVLRVAAPCPRGGGPSAGRLGLRGSGRAGCVLLRLRAAARRNPGRPGPCERAIAARPAGPRPPPDQRGESALRGGRPRDLAHFEQFQRLTNDHTCSFTTEEIFDCFAIDGDRAVARAKKNPCRRSFATTGTVILGDCHD